MSTADTQEQEYEVAIIGGGIMGTALFSELVRAGINCVLLEASDDVSNGSTKGNSGIIHSGYDPMPNSLMAKFNVAGNKMYKAMCKRLSVGYKSCGTLVVAREEEKEKLNLLMERGKTNGVPSLKIITDPLLHQMEPNLIDEIKYGLYAPTAGIVSPYLVCVALAEEGVINGGIVLKEFLVDKAEKNSEYYTIYGNSGKENEKKVNAKYIVNCAGAGADKVNTIFGLPSTPCIYVKGVYILLDKSQNNFVHRPIFPLPTALGKGVLAIPTIHGNVMFGPTAHECEPFDTSVDVESLNEIKAKIATAVKQPNFRKTIKLFAGVRNKCGNDFVIKKAEQIEHYFYTLGIQSPGLTSAPAIAQYLCQELIKDGIKTKKIKLKVRKPYPDLTEMDAKSLKKVIKENPDYGKIICRCEGVSLGEIKDVLNSPLKPRTVDAVKRRIRTTMGRCQGSFCLPKIIKIISTVCDIPKEEVSLCGEGSEFIVGDIKQNGYFEKIKETKKMVKQVRKN